MNIPLHFPGYIESFNGRLRDELLDGEIFYSLREARIVIESWRRHYNTIRPYASLGYCLRRVAGCATPTGSAGHAGATASLKLTFHLDHSVGLITTHRPNGKLGITCGLFAAAIRDPHRSHR